MEKVIYGEFFEIDVKSRRWAAGNKFLWKLKLFVVLRLKDWNLLIDFQGFFVVQVVVVFNVFFGK